MNRRIVSGPVGSYGNLARLPVQTQDLTHGQTAQVRGGAIRWRNILRDLFGIDLGTDLPETSTAGPLL